MFILNDFLIDTEQYALFNTNNFCNKPHQQNRNGTSGGVMKPSIDVPNLYMSQNILPHGLYVKRTDLDSCYCEFHYNVNHVNDDIKIKSFDAVYDHVLMTIFDGVKKGHY